jgi:ribose 5-phosphate isomerase B
MRVAIGSDHAGFDYKEALKENLAKEGYEFCDAGTFSKASCDYPDIAVLVSEKIISGDCDMGILICGTGIGMCITANKVPGIRAAVCHDSYSTTRARCSNDAQIMCMGARVIGTELAKQLVEIWLKNDFSGGGSTKKVEKINEIEARYTRKVS